MDEKGAKGTFKGWADGAGGLERDLKGMLHLYPECDVKCIQAAK